MDQDLFLFQKSHPDQSFIDHIFTYDVRNLESTDDVEISKFVIALSQYLIYFKSKTNESKQHLTQKKRLLEASISQIIDKDIIKKHGTKTDARNYLIYNTRALNEIQNDIDRLSDEDYILDGIDKTISELIAAFKRELTRRENELYQRRNSK